MQYVQSPFVVLSTERCSHGQGSQPLRRAELVGYYTIYVRNFGATCADFLFVGRYSVKKKTRLRKIQCGVTTKEVVPIWGVKPPPKRSGYQRTNKYLKRVPQEPERSVQSYSSPPAHPARPQATRPNIPSPYYPSIKPVNHQMHISFWKT